jgi:hypothetical protein
MDALGAPQTRRYGHADSFAPRAAAPVAKLELAHDEILQELPVPGHPTTAKKPRSMR